MNNNPSSIDNPTVIKEIPVSGPVTTPEIPGITDNLDNEFSAPKNVEEPGADTNPVVEAKIENIVKAGTEAKSNKSGKFGPKLEEQVHTVANIDLEALVPNSKAFVIKTGPEVPSEIIELMDTIAMKLAMKKYVLRTKFDKRNALEAHVSSYYAYKEAYLIWPTAEKNVDTTAGLGRPVAQSYSADMWLRMKTQKSFDPEAYNKSNPYAKLHGAAGAHLYLGKDLRTPPGFIIIYTPSGDLFLSREYDYKSNPYEVTQALKIAKLLGIKVYNLGNAESVKELELMLTSI